MWSSQVGSTKNVKKAHLGSISAEEQAEGLCCKHQLWDGESKNSFLLQTAPIF